MTGIIITLDCKAILLSLIKRTKHYMQYKDDPWYNYGCKKK